MPQGENSYSYPGIFLSFPKSANWNLMTFIFYLSEPAQIMYFVRTIYNTNYITHTWLASSVQWMIWEGVAKQ